MVFDQLRTWLLITCHNANPHSMTYRYLAHAVSAHNGAAGVHWPSVHWHRTLVSANRHRPHRHWSHWHRSHWRRSLTLAWLVERKKRHLAGYARPWHAQHGIAAGIGGAGSWELVASELRLPSALAMIPEVAVRLRVNRFSGIASQKRTPEL